MGFWGFAQAPGSLFTGFVDRNKDVHVGLLTFASNLNVRDFPSFRKANGD